MAAHKRAQSMGCYEVSGTNQTKSKEYRTYPTRPLARSSSPLLKFLIQREEYYAVFDRICSYLGIKDIVSVTRTCKRLSSLYQALLATQWNVNRALRHFVDDPCLFRSKLGEYDALVSGSFALQFFDRVFWPESDLDIFLPDAQEEGFGTYLSNSEGYTCIRSSLGGYEDYPGMEGKKVRTYVRINKTNGRETTVQTVATLNLPLQVILQSFFTSAVVNIITWNKAYAVYPLPTFIHRKTYILRKLNEYRGSLLLKYSQRGWKTQGTLWTEEETSSHPFQAQRRVGDKFTWTIPLPAEGVRSSPVPDSVIEYSCFSIRKSKPEYPSECTTLRYVIQAVEFSALTLKYLYTYSGTKPNFWHDFVNERTNELSFLEIWKLDPEDRPNLFRDYISVDLVRSEHLISRENLPDTWTFYDDEIPRWHEVWKQRLKEIQSRYTPLALY